MLTCIGTESRLRKFSATFLGTRPVQVHAQSRNSRGKRTGSSNSFYWRHEGALGYLSAVKECCGCQWNQWVFVCTAWCKINPKLQRSWLHNYVNWFDSVICRSRLWLLHSSPQAHLNCISDSQLKRQWNGCGFKLSRPWLL